MQQVTTCRFPAEGDWWVQDAAARMPVKILAPQKGEAVLIFPAPWWQTMQLAAAGAQANARGQRRRNGSAGQENLGGYTCGQSVSLNAARLRGEVRCDFAECALPATGNDPSGTLICPMPKMVRNSANLIETAIEFDRTMAWSPANPGGRPGFSVLARMLPMRAKVQVDEA